MDCDERVLLHCLDALVRCGIRRCDSAQADVEDSVLVVGTFAERGVTFHCSLCSMWKVEKSISRKRGCSLRVCSNMRQFQGYLLR